MKKKTIYNDTILHPVKKGDKGFFEAYAQRIGKEKFCPFIEPALDHSLLFKVVKELSQYHFSEQELESEMLYHAILITEKFRATRQKLNDTDAALLCVNIVYQFPREWELKGEKLLAWPHWILKCLYTEASIMFGKFWIREQMTSLYGRSISEPTCNFLSIRSAVKSRDPELLVQQKNIIETLILSEDKNQCPFKVMNLPHPSNVSESITKIEFYERLKNWADSIKIE